MALSASQIEQFESDGYLVVEQYYTPEEVDKLKKEMAWILEGSMDQLCSMSGVFNAEVEDGKQNSDKYFLESGDKVRFFYEDVKEPPPRSFTGRRLSREKAPLNKVGHALHWHSTAFKRASLQHEKTKELLRSLGFVRPCICQSMYIFKRAKVGGAVRPHTDGTFLMTTGNLLGLWTPLENATIENGCLWFEPGSHRTREITSFFERTTDESSGETVMKLRHTQPPPSEEELNLVPVEMKAGDLVLIHKAVLHKSERNASDKPRDAFTFHVTETYNTQWSKLNWLQNQASPGSFSMLYDDSKLHKETK